jgi:hypothetical protein
MSCPVCDQPPLTEWRCWHWYTLLGVRHACRLRANHPKSHHGDGLRWWTYGNGRTAKVRCAQALPR